MFPGQTYAGPSPLTQQGIAAYGNVNPYEQGMGYQQDVLAGNYLGMNPQMQAAVMDPAMANVASRFAAGGRYGSPASQTSMAEAGMRAMMPYYDAERQRQQQASMMLPALQQGMAGSLLQGGQLQEGYDQMAINEAMERYYYNPLLRSTQAVAPFMGGAPTQGSTTMGGGNALQGALSGGLGGAMMGAAVPGFGAGPASLLGPAGWAGLGAGMFLGAL